MWFAICKVWRLMLVAIWKCTERLMIWVAILLCHDFDLTNHIDQVLLITVYKVVDNWISIQSHSFLPPHHLGTKTPLEGKMSLWQKLLSPQIPATITAKVFLRRASVVQLHVIVLNYIKHLKNKLYLIRVRAEWYEKTAVYDFCTVSVQYKKI